MARMTREKKRKFSVEPSVTVNWWCWSLAISVQVWPRHSFTLFMEVGPVNFVVQVIP